MENIFELANYIAFGLLDNENFIGVGVNEKENLILLYTKKNAYDEKIDKLCQEILKDTGFRHVFVNPDYFVKQKQRRILFT